MLSGIAAAISALASTVAAQAQPAPAPVPAPTVTLGPAQQIGDRPPTQLDPTPTGGVDDSGRALLVRALYPARGGRSQIVVASAAPGAPFGPPRAVGSGDEPLGAVGPEGRAVIASSAGSGAELLIGDASGAFGRPITLSRTRRPRAVVVAGDGTAAVVLIGDGTGSVVQLVTLDGRLLPPQRFDETTRGSLETGVDGGGEFTPSRLAAGPDGTIALLTQSGLLERRPGEERFARRHAVFDREHADPQVAVGTRGRIGVVAIDRPDCISEYGCVGGIVFAQRRAGAARFSRPMRPRVRRYPKDEGEKVPSANAPQVAYGAGRTPILAWTEDDDVCTVCDMDTTDGPLIAWQPGARRTTVAPNGFALLAPAGRGVALLAVEPFDPVVESKGRLGLLFAGGGRTTRLGATRLPSDQGLRFIGGRSRLLIAALDDGIVRAVLGEVRDR